MNINICAVLVLIAAGINPASGSAAAAESPRYDLLIHGGTLIDGTGAPPRQADVLISGDQIVRVGDFDGVNDIVGAYPDPPAMYDWYEGAYSASKRCPRTSTSNYAPKSCQIQILIACGQTSASNPAVRPRPRAFT